MRIHVFLAWLSILGFATVDATAQALPGNVAFVRSAAAGGNTGSERGDRDVAA
jgi:hypothetical protein